MIDYHNHILPNIDDGARDFDEALMMIEKAYSGGITHIISTVHFNHPQIKVSKDYNYLLSLAKELEDRAKAIDISIKITPSAEVYFNDQILESINNPIVRFREKYILIEFDPQILPKNFSNVLYEIQLNGLKVIIAHPERYRNIQNEINIIKQWKNKDVLIQVNAGSILGYNGLKIKKTAMDIIFMGYCDIIGSDAHNLSTRPFCLEKAYKKIEVLCGKNTVEILKYNAEAIVENKLLKQTPKASKSFFRMLKSLVK
tara:strand:- start:14149 stop:14919 length:771 start_codon:yes stop_codon:yes gene_type:complete